MRAFPSDGELACEHTYKHTLKPARRMKKRVNNVQCVKNPGPWVFFKYFHGLLCNTRIHHYMCSLLVVCHIWDYHPVSSRIRFVGYNTVYWCIDVQLYRNYRVFGLYIYYVSGSVSRLVDLDYLCISGSTSIFRWYLDLCPCVLWCSRHGVWVQCVHVNLNITPYNAW